MSEIRRRLYRGIIVLHPAVFRNEFGGEMQLDFEAALGNTGFGFLLLDALLSLGRQWAASVFPAAAELEPVARPSLLAGQYVVASPGRPSFFDLARASVLCGMFYLAIGFALTASSGRTATGPQVGLASPHTHSEQGQRSPTEAQQAAYVHHAALNGGVVLDQGKKADAPAAAEGRRPQTSRPSTFAVRQHSHFSMLYPLSPALSPPAIRKHLGLWASGAGLWPSIVLVGLLWLVLRFARRNPRVARKIVLATLGFLAIAAPAAFGIMRRIPAQILHSSDPLPSFEVASVRPWKPQPSAAPAPPPPPADGTIAAPKRRERIVPLGGGGQTTDRVQMILPANLLITFAYGLPLGFENHILGAPDWASSDQYEIQAKIDGSLFAAMQTMTPAQQRQQVALMEQSLLADRFRMKVHFEKRELPMFALVVAKGGPKLTPAKDGETPRLSLVDVGGGLQMTATAIPLDTWIHSPFLGGRQVVDQTGLKGVYDFQLTWQPAQAAISDAGQEGGADQPLLLQAIQEQLGLKLVQTKGPVEVIVIDHIERPSAN